MLTKELLKFRVRKDVIQPSLMARSNEELLAYLKGFLSIAQAGAGKRVYELEQEWEAHGCNEHPLYLAFKKLVLDRAQVDDDDASIAEQRWQWLKEAQIFRQEQLFADREAFQEAFAAENTCSFDLIAERLYADLPEYRRIISLETIEPLALLDHYNLAQVQGLVIRAKWLEFEVSGASLKEKRDLFRAIKFHRLLAEVETKDLSDLEAIGSLKVRVSGPLSVLQNTQTYGFRLANFFPRILHLKKWTVRALVALPERKKDFQLELSHKKGLSSPYAPTRSYVPEDFQHFIAAFNERAQDQWLARPGDEFVHIGRQSYCFPDVTFEAKSGEKIYLELFHKWHWQQLESRLKVLINNPVKQLVIGVCRSIAKKPQMKKILEESQWFAQNGLVFTDFPSPKSLLTVLGRRDSL